MGKNLPDLPIVCLLDTGVSPKIFDYVKTNDPFNFFDLNETIPHGTSVGGIIIFGEDLLEKEKN